MSVVISSTYKFITRCFYYYCNYRGKTSVEKKLLYTMMLNLCMFLIFQVFYILVVSITSNKSNDLGFFLFVLKLRLMLTNKAENCVFYGSNYMLLYVKFRPGVVGTVDLRQTEDK